ncbi:hypothetical protein AA21952_2558 [Acetobacter oeni LMG 21952]|nr:hypothetical protein AA21952_2558 [Acetobacter oeni LMG 21952]
MRETLHLRFDGGHDAWMPVADIHHGDTGREIDIAASFDIPEFRALSTICVDCRGGPYTDGDSRRAAFGQA